MKIIFATNNQHKVDEIRSALPENLSIITLKEAGIDIVLEKPFHFKDLRPLIREILGA